MLHAVIAYWLLNVSLPCCWSFCKASSRSGTAWNSWASSEVFKMAWEVAGGCSTTCIFLWVLFMYSCRFRTRLDGNGGVFQVRFPKLSKNHRDNGGGIDVNIVLCHNIWITSLALWLLCWRVHCCSYRLKSGLRVTEEHSNSSSPKLPKSFSDNRLGNDSIVVSCCEAQRDWLSLWCFHCGLRF